LFGAWWNYLLGKYVGKVFLERYGRYFLITHEKYDKAERLFMWNDRLYTFLGRFIPVVRHLISIPAGIFRMNPWWFSGLTFVGATIWCAILTGVGYYVGPSVLELARTYSHEANIIAIVLIFAGALWFIAKK
jgi:membrane protein DedA with SNARE-associated domain